MKNIFRNFICCALLFSFIEKANAQGQSTGDIKVTVTDEKSQPMVGAVVMIIAGGPQLGGSTDDEGNFTFRSLAPGTYDIQAKMMSYKKYVKTGIEVSAGQTSYTNFPMQLATCDTCRDVITIKATRSLVDPTFSTVENISAGEVKHMAADHSNIGAIAESHSSQLSVGKGGKLVMRGARETASSIYVDGEVMYGTAGVCGGAIQQVTVLSGGIPAEYGDLTGGAVIITTKSFYSGYAAKETMYQEAADSKAAAQKEADEKSGKIKVNGNQIIEKISNAGDSTQVVAPH